MFRIFWARNPRSGRWDWTFLAMLGGLLLGSAAGFVAIAYGWPWWKALLPAAPFYALALYANHVRNIEVRLLIHRELMERARQ